MGERERELARRAVDAFNAADVEIAKRFYELWAEGGVAGLRPELHDEAEWHVHPQAPEPGPFRGREEVIRVAASYARGFGRYRAVPHEILPGFEPDEILALATYTTVGREGGREFTMPVGHLLKVRDGKVSYFEEIPDQLDRRHRRGRRGPRDRDGRQGRGDRRPCGPAEWVRHRLDDPEVLAREDEALVVATLVPAADAGGARRLAARIGADPMGLINRLTVLSDVDAARADFEAERR